MTVGCDQRIPYGGAVGFVDDSVHLALSHILRSARDCDLLNRTSNQVFLFPVLNGRPCIHLKRRFVEPGQGSADRKSDADERIGGVYLFFEPNQVHEMAKEVGCMVGSADVGHHVGLQSVPGDGHVRRPARAQHGEVECSQPAIHGYIASHGTAPLKTANEPSELGIVLGIPAIEAVIHGPACQEPDPVHDPGLIEVHPSIGEVPLQIRKSAVLIPRQKARNAIDRQISKGQSKSVNPTPLRRHAPSQVGLSPAQEHVDDLFDGGPRGAGTEQVGQCLPNGGC